MSADEAVDVRLVPAALAVWAAAVLAVCGTAGVLVGAGAVVGALAAAVLGVRPRAEAPARSARRARAWGAVRAGPRPPDRAARRPPDRAALRGQGGLALGAVAVLLLATGTQVRAREAGDIRGLAEERARVRLAGTVRSTPQPPGGGGGSGGVVRFLLAVDSVADVGAGRGAEQTTGRDAGQEAEQEAGQETRRAGGPRATASRAAVEVYAPATASDLAYGTRVVVEARLSPVPDVARRAMARARADGDLGVRAPPPTVLRVADGVRAGLVATAATVPGDAGRLLPAVAVGDTRGVGDLDDAMRVSGLAHITAVSGAHFSILGAVVLAVVTRCGVPRRWRWLPLVVALGGFVAVVQPGSSVVRAAVMGAVGVLGIVVGRPARSVPALACAVIVLLVVDPWLARDVGFVLSVVATAGIALLAGPLARRWSATAGASRTRATSRAGADELPAAHPVATAFAVPVAAQAVCGPVLLVLTPAVSAYAVLANAVAAPAVAPATVGGLLAAVLGPWWPAGATWCAQGAGAACWWIAAVARTATGLPGAQVAWAGGALGQVLLACACGAALVLVLRCRRAVGR
ncbi:ComEC/Rec2 family competence protein [Cellulosimicrobium cellulans]|uniref:ComEC/Rec2 family competence protein n=1 Tax=Cellulosimicrobium cellulans TaxID=1710 RepID=UPI00130D695E|nr:ComEC/Rec2 family competence protein [Cellulosimicrobium cellulans]